MGASTGLAMDGISVTSFVFELSQSLLSRLRASLPVSPPRQLQVIDTISQTIMLHRAVEDASTGSDSDYSK